MTETPAQAKRSKFPPLYWLVVLFEFFERGSYYGVMSVLSVYLTDELGIAKQDVGLIKGTIQPLLYFLPIISGALADRFGYRRFLLIAFALLGGGYFLTYGANEYSTVFLCLVVMGLGAGTFKPIISGTIARCTDASNSTLGFGIFYWSINLGAFLVPLFLVPVMKQKFNTASVLLAAAIGTGIMILPTIFAFREPPKPKGEDDSKKEKASLLQTLANAFEIIYSPIILLALWMGRSGTGKAVTALLLLGTLGLGGWLFATPSGVTDVFSARGYELAEGRFVVDAKPNLCKPKPFELKLAKDGKPTTLHLFNPNDLESYRADVMKEMAEIPLLANVSEEDLTRYRDEATQKTILDVEFGGSPEGGFSITKGENRRVTLTLADLETYEDKRDELTAAVQADPQLSKLQVSEIDELVSKADKHSFLLLYVGILLLVGLLIQRFAPRKAGDRNNAALSLGILAVVYALIWMLPGLSMFARILTSVLSLPLLSLTAIDYTDTKRFRDHFRFLFMIFIYSGFWVLYFQMFDSVLWYVTAYVDSSAVNAVLSPVMNGIYGLLGVEIDWHFDVEFVTVINAFTIICLQLIISGLVKNTRALPTMIFGIVLATIGMAILAISTDVWVFMAGIVIFSIGEMTAHPKFISYVGQTAPKSRVAMYMGYLFLYGVIGSSIGGVVGANLYVKYVDELNQPSTLWLICASIGVATVIGLLLFNRFAVEQKPAADAAG